MCAFRYICICMCLFVCVRFWFCTAANMPFYRTSGIKYSHLTPPVLCIYTYNEYYICMHTIYIYLLLYLLLYIFMYVCRFVCAVKGINAPYHLRAWSSWVNMYVCISMGMQTQWNILYTNRCEARLQIFKIMLHLLDRSMQKLDC